MSCECVKRWRLEQGRASDSHRAATYLQDPYHPVWISLQRCQGYARKGGVFYAVLDGEDHVGPRGGWGSDVGVAVIRPNASVLIALNVIPEHRGHGLGSALLRYVAPNWARVIEPAVPWFEREDFQVVGQPKQGRKHRTFIMVRKDLIGLAGRLDRLHLDEPVDAGKADGK